MCFTARTTVVNFNNCLLYYLILTRDQARRNRARSPTPGKYLGSDRARSGGRGTSMCILFVLHLITIL